MRTVTLMTQRLIDANDLMDHACRDRLDSRELIWAMIENAPTVDVVPVVHGHWLKALGSMPPEVFGRHVCSVCDHFAPNDYHGKHEFLSPICPYCGAKMGEDSDDIAS